MKGSGWRRSPVPQAEWQKHPRVERAKIVSKQAKDTYVVTNNHFLGKAVVNALELASFLSERPVQAPDQLVQHYPVLKQIAAEKAAQEIR